MVDGYNVIHCTPRYEKLVYDHSDDPYSSDVHDMARTALINDVAAFAQGRYEAVIVFDGAGNISSERPNLPARGVRIEFSPTGVSADTVVQKLCIEAREEGRACSVVSSDGTIQAVVMGKGVTRISSRMLVDEIKKIEEAYAKTETPVVSNNSAHRWTPDVPMMVPEINPEHMAVIEAQKKRLGTKRGFVAVKPNCSIQSYAPVLTAWKEFEPYEVVATTYQAISGAGKTFADWPEMVGNIIPYIGGEEEKSEKEPLRLWGKVEDGVIVPAQSPVITCQCIRVPVLNGHTAAVFVKFKKKPTKEELIDRLVHFSGEPQRLELPSAPKQFIQYLEEDNRPQIALDVNYENGMGISVGRLREDTVYDWKFVGLSHNTVRGAAGGAVLCAELLKAQGYITKK